MAKHSKSSSKIKKNEVRGGLIVKTPQDTHLFPDSSSLKQYINFLRTKESIEQLYSFELVQDIYTQLSKIQFDQSWIIQEKDFCGYRVVFGKYDPLDIAGTLAAGGRFNIGGAQHTEKFGGLGKMRGGLYVASSKEVAKIEASLPDGVDSKLYRVKKKSIQSVWKFVDVEKAVRSLESKLKMSQSLSSLMASPPISGAWLLMKQPMATQIIGQWLREKSKSNGLVFRSTKSPGSLLYFLFFDSSAESNDCLVSSASRYDSDID